MLIGSNEAADLAREAAARLSGDPLHREFDRLSNRILRSLGYGEFVDAFEAAVAGVHTPRVVTACNRPSSAPCGERGGILRRGKMANDRYYPAVVVRFDEQGEMTCHIGGGGVQVFVIDERCPHDRVYELTDRVDIAEIAAMVGASPIGHKEDERHEALSARVVEATTGKPRLTVVP